MIRNYNVNIEILTPVIINTGESFEYCEIYPTGKPVIIKDNDTSLGIPESFRFYQNRMDKLFDNLKDFEAREFIDESSTAIINRDNQKLVELRKSLMDKADKASRRVPGRILPLAMEALSEKPMQKVDKVMQEEMAGNTYIPGSSVKGAIRTAILEFLREKKGIGNNYFGDNNKRQLEGKILLGKDFFKIEEDPFRYFRVSDFKLNGINGIQYIAKVGDDEVPIYSTMTNSYALSGKSVIAEGSISVDSEFYRSLGLNEDINKLLEIVGDKFYMENWNSAVSSITSPIMKKIHQKMGIMWNGGYQLIRIGHYIGIQNCTLNVMQSRPPKGAKPNINMTGGRIVKIEGGIIPGVCMMKIKEM